MSLINVSDGFKVVQGDLLLDDADILVCPVNCIAGIMGAGLAKGFADRFDSLKDEHRRACRDRRLVIGKPVIIDCLERAAPTLFKPQLDIVLFPTKDHYRCPSRIGWVYQGLATLYRDLSATVGNYNTPVEIAIPALGCGLGELDFGIVGPLISAWALALPEAYHVRLYRPHTGN